jgi:hypothetical protein
LTDFAVVQTVILIIWIAQFLASFAAAFFANCDLRSVLFSGPVLSLLGLLFASASLSRRSWSYLILGLSAPSICALCAFLIAAFRLGPQWETGWPIAVILVVYSIAISPVAVVVLLDVRRTSPDKEIAPAWRFSMKTLFVITTVVCFLSVPLRFAVELAELHADSAVFVLFAIFTVVLSTLVAWRFAVRRRTLTPCDSVK